MAALSVTNSFVAGTSIVASQMNANFTDVVNWATGAPTLSTSGSTTTISGALAVTEAPVVVPVTEMFFPCVLPDSSSFEYVAILPFL